MIVFVILFVASAGALLWIYLFMKRRERLGTVDGDIPIPDELLQFLEDADDGYILAHETRQMSFFSTYASPAVCHEILDRIHNNPPKLFGTRSHRSRIWRVSLMGDRFYLIRKTLAHRTVTTGYGVRITLGDDMEEVWRVSVLPGGYRVEDVN